MVKYAHRCYPIEPFHEEAKTLLGWDDYQGQLKTGFHHHATLVMLSYSFLQRWECQQRQQQPRAPGRLRAPFSPSAG